MDFSIGPKTSILFDLEAIEEALNIFLEYLITNIIIINEIR